MRDFDYLAPHEIDEALALLSTNGSTALAGGTDLLTLMKEDITAPQRVVNIKRLPGLSGITEEANGLHIGALTRLSDIETSAVIRNTWPALAEAAAVAATPQIRNQATIAGNLLQRPRCWYFRDSLIDCWLKGGDTCPMREGENRFGAIFDDSECTAVHPSDLAPVLVMLNATAAVRSSDGETEYRIEELLQAPTAARRREDVLDQGDLITSIWLPRPAEGTRMTYLKAMDRKVWAFALVSVAVSLRLGNGRIDQASVVLGGVANTPKRVSRAEELLRGASLQEVDPSSIAIEALRDAVPLSQNAYKITLAKSLLRRALVSVIGT